VSGAAEAYPRLERRVANLDATLAERDVD